jgi:hypothetical protein
VEWNFYALELDQENVYNETFLTDTFVQAAQPYFEDVKVEIQAPDIMNITGTWQNIPLDVSTRVRMGEKNPRVTLAEINDFPLFIIGDNISQGINNGIDEAFRKGPVDVSHLVVQDEKIVFEVEKTQEQDRPDYATPTPAPTPTPTPLPTPTPVNVTLVVVFNDSDTPLTLQIEALNQTWDIAAQDTQVLQTPPGTYTYTVKYQGTDTVAAEGSRTWTLNKAYRLRINLAETAEPQ